MEHRAAPGAARGPRFGGGRYRPPGFFWIGTSEADYPEQPKKNEGDSGKQFWNIS